MKMIAMIKKIEESWPFIIGVWVCGMVLLCFSLIEPRNRVSRPKRIITECHSQGYWYLFGHILYCGHHANDCVICHPQSKNATLFNELIKAENYIQKNQYLEDYIPKQTYVDAYGQKFDVVLHKGIWCSVQYHYGYIGGGRHDYIPLTSLVDFKMK